ncbi:ClpP/crotonase [Powellomyces hirtus]|nr:ClpP/crotonase [Powellomyces hirtus]
MPGNYINTTVKPGGYAELSIQREPVNSMNLEMWEQLTAALDKLEQDPKVRGVIFHSGLARPVFTAGNDIKELYAPATSGDRYLKFWSISNKFLARLSNSPLLTVAAIKGACPAGGTCLAMACDFRIITENGSMGLNEVALGIPVPAKWVKLMSTIIGQGRADKMCQFGKMVGSKEALAIGFVDKVVADEETLMPTAQKTIEQLLRLPDQGRQLTKNGLRGDLANEWGDAEWLKFEAENAWTMLSHPKTVKALEGVLARLSKAKI